MRTELNDLLARVRSATGRERQLDAAIADLLRDADSMSDAPEYTASVDACIELVHRVLPGWGWHVGYGPRGVVPYAAVSNGPTRHAASAPTVPLALLAAMLMAKIGFQAPAPERP